VKTIQIRNVPDSLHRALVRRANARGQTLTAFVKDILEREAARPAPEQVFARMARQPRIQLPMPAAELVHRERPG